MKSVLVTGCSGTFGQTFIADLLQRPGVERVVGLSRDELKQSVMASRFGHDSRLRLFLGDVRDRSRLEEAFYGCDVVVHAAALKRVDAVAYDSDEARKTNVDGTANVIKAAIAQGVGKVVVLSSDKAVHATNFYGATKFLAEQLAVAGNVYGYPRGTRIACTRYGNVLGSRGSVLHVWREHLAAGRPLPLTHSDISRFWMTIQQAVELVHVALRRMDGGEIFLPKLPGLSLRALAAAMAGPDYPLTLTGLRPGGEKLHEELLSPGEVERTFDAGDCYVIAPSLAPWRTHQPAYGPPVPADFRYTSNGVREAGADELRAMLDGA